MTFDRSWVLLIAWLPLAWGAYEWSRTRRKLALALKALSFFAVMLAFAEPRLELNETKLAVSVLVDTSASASQADLDKASELARKITGSRGRNTVNVVPFARETRPLNSNEAKSPLHLTSTTGEAGRSTNLEAAVREAIAALPAGQVPRLTLISDGKENEGSVARAAWQARDLGIPIDTYALAGRSKPSLNLDSATFPAVAYTGEPFPIDLVVSSPTPVSAMVEMSAEGKVLGQTPVDLMGGQNPIRLHAALNTPGALELAVSVKPMGSSNTGDLQVHQAMVLRKPKTIFFSNDSEKENENFLKVLTDAQFEVKYSNGLPPDFKFGDYQLVIFNNWDLESIPEPEKKDINEYVSLGGGLLIIGGDRNVYTEDRADNDILERAMPANLAPPRSPEGVAVTLIIDKSSSMETGRKMDLAHRASIGVVNNLRPIDTVGVLMFDNTFEWAVTMRKAEDKAYINKQIAGIQPDGGTQIAPALTEAYNKMKPIKAASRHIVLLTDGISEEGNSLTLAKTALADQVTISTVGIGADVNTAYLDRVATAAGGKAYFVTDLSQLEQILVKDVLEHTGQTAIEKPLSIAVDKRVEILNDVDIDHAPVLKGYVRFTPKPSAETILSVDKDPLLSRWQFGLGRAAVFASDAKSRWAADWITWKGYPKFWTNVARDLLPRSEGGEARVEYDSANGDLIASYRLGRGVKEPAKIPFIFAFGPSGFQKQMPVTQTAAGTYQGRIHIGEKQGLFRVRPLEDSQAFPEAGIYRPESELTDYGNNVELLKQVAAFTGGRFEPAPDAIFQSTGRAIPTTLSLWPALLGLAILLSLAELVIRKWNGLFAAKAP